AGNVLPGARGPVGSLGRQLCDRDRGVLFGGEQIVYSHLRIQSHAQDHEAGHPASHHHGALDVRPEGGPVITGWTTQPLDGRLLDAPLPAPHVVRYRDRAPVAVRVPGAEILVVRQADANEAAMVGGLNADGESAMDVTITIR